jgi:hypothetical protein
VDQSHIGGQVRTRERRAVGRLATAVLAIEIAPHLRLDLRAQSGARPRRRLRPADPLGAELGPNHARAPVAPAQILQAAEGPGDPAGVGARANRRGLTAGGAVREALHVGPTAAGEQGGLRGREPAQAFAARGPAQAAYGREEPRPNRYA